MNLGKFSRILSRLRPAGQPAPSRQEQYIAKLRQMDDAALLRECVGAMVTLADLDKSRSAMPAALAGADLVWAEKRWSCCREECQRRERMPLWLEARSEVERRGA